MGEPEKENKMLLINVMMDSKEISNFKAELLKTKFKRNIFTILFMYIYLCVKSLHLIKTIKCVSGTRYFRCMINTCTHILVDEIKDKTIQ